MVALGLDDTLDLLLHATDGCGHATSRQRLRCFLQAFDEVSLGLLAFGHTLDQRLTNQMPNGVVERHPTWRWTLPAERALRVERQWQ